MNERGASTVGFSPVSDRMGHTSGMTKPKVAFICVHNSCRSQIAEALGKLLAGDVYESYSAGTETRPQIDPDAVRLMKTLYGLDMEQTQYSKLISDKHKTVKPAGFTVFFHAQPTFSCSFRDILI